jgi:hypothetical protein
MHVPVHAVVLECVAYPVGALSLSERTVESVIGVVDSVACVVGRERDVSVVVVGEACCPLRASRRARASEVGLHDG